MLNLDFKSALVIDDDELFGQALGRWLLELGYQGRLVATAAGAVEALNAQSEWALILLDLGLPDIPGHALLRQLNAHGVGTPIIVVSGTEDVHDVVRAWRARAADFLRKPFGVDELASAIARATRPRPARVKRAVVVNREQPRKLEAGGRERPQTAEAPLSAAGPPSISRTPSSTETARERPRAIEVPISPPPPLSISRTPSSVEAARETPGRRTDATPPVSRPDGRSSSAAAAAPSDDGSLLDLLNQAIRGGTIEIPVVDPSVANLQQFLTRNDFTMQEVADAVSRDGALATGVLRIANSAQFARGSTVTSLNEACSRLGANRVVGIALEVAVRNQFTLSEEPYRTIMSSVWRNAAATALLAEGLGKALGRSDGDDLYLSGLLHNLGEIVCVKLLAEADRSGVALPDQDNLWTLVTEIHERFGRAVASRWKLPSNLTKVIGHHHRPARTPENIEDRKKRLLIVGAWALAVEQGYAYFPEHPGAESRRYLATLGVKSDAVEKLIADLASWGI